MKKISSLLSIIILCLGITSASTARADSLITIDGSSTVYPITEAVSEEYQASKKGAVKVTVGISGTGGGFKKFCRGELDIANASRPIKVEEMASCREGSVKYIELPVGYDALTVVINPKNTWAKSMTVDELKKIWAPEAQGVITKWNQIRPEWPDAPLKLYGAGSDSGTFDYFTEAIVGKAKASRGDYTASEDDNVLVQGVGNDINALGYFGYAYYAENNTRLTAVAIDNGKGGVLPSAATVLDSTYAPLSRPVFIYVSKKGLDKPEVVEFVKFYLQNAAQLVAEVKYIPLTPGQYSTISERLDKQTFGTTFSGSKPGAKMEETLALSPRN